MAEEVVAAKLSVPVESDTTGFGQRLRKKLRKETQGIKVEVPVEADTTGLRRQVKAAVEEAEAGQGIDVPVDVNAATLRTKLLAAVQAASAGVDAQVGVDVDTDGLRARIVTAVQAATAGVTTNVGVNLSGRGLRRRLKAATEAAEAGVSADVGTDVDAATLRQRLLAAVKAASRGLTAPVRVVYKGARRPFRGRQRDQEAADAPDERMSWWSRMRNRRRGGGGRHRGGGDGGDFVDGPDGDGGPSGWQGLRRTAGWRVLTMGGRLVGMASMFSTALSIVVGAVAGAVPMLGSALNMVDTLAVAPLMLTGVGAAIGGLLVAFSGMTGDLSELPPNMRAVRLEAESLADEWARLKRTVQESFWAPIRGHLKEAGEVLIPALTESYKGMMTELGIGGRQLLDWVASDEFVAETKVVGRASERLARDFRQMLFGVEGHSQGLVQFLGDVMVATEPLQARIGAGMTNFGEWLASLYDTPEEKSALATELDYAADKATQIGRILRSAWTGLAGIFRGGRGVGDSLLGSFEEFLHDWSVWANSTEGQERIGEVFRNLKPLVLEVGRLLRDAGLEILRIVQNPEFAETVRKLRTELLPVIGEVVEAMATNVGPGVIELLSNIAELVLRITGDGQLIGTILGGINLFLDGLNTFLQNNPAAATVVGGIVTALLGLNLLSGLAGGGGVLSLLIGLFSGIRGMRGGGGIRGLLFGGGSGGGLLGGLLGVMTVRFAGPQPVIVVAGVGAVGGGGGGGGGKKNSGRRGGSTVVGGGDSSRRRSRPGRPQHRGPGWLSRTTRGAGRGLGRGLGRGAGLLAAPLLWAAGGIGRGAGAAGRGIGRGVGAAAGSIGRGARGAGRGASARLAQMRATPERGSVRIPGAAAAAGRAPGALRGGIVRGAGVVGRGAGALLGGPIGIASIGGSIAGEAIRDNNGGVRDAGGGMLSGAATGAGLGAMIGSIIPGVGTAIGAGVGGVIGGGIGLATSGASMDQVKEELSSSLDSISSSVSSTWDKVTAVTGPTWESFKNNVTVGAITAADKVGLFKRDAEGHVTGLDLAGPARFAVDTMASVLPPGVQTALTNLGVFKTNADGSTRVDLGGVGNFAATTLGSALPFGIGTALGHLGRFRSGADPSSRVSLGSVGSFAVSTLAGALPFGVGAALGHLTRFRSAAPGSVSVNLAGAGRTIIGSLIGGIQSMYSRVVGAARAVGQWIVDNKGPISYDRVMLRPAGQAIIGGLIGTMESLYPNVGRSLRGLSEDMAATEFGVNAGLDGLYQGRASTRGLAAVGGAGDRKYDITVNNPAPEKAGNSITSAMSKIAYLGLDGGEDD